MKTENRMVVYDDILKIEAYRFEGISQPFPNHFHEHYVMGLVIEGERILLCQNRKMLIGKGAILLFNPGNNHACEQRDGGNFHYWGMNLGKETMLELAEDVIGKQMLLRFTENVIWDEEIFRSLKLLHEKILGGADGFEKEEQLCLLIAALIQRCGQHATATDDIPGCRKEIEKVCDYIEQHFSEHISLNQMSSYVGISRSTLLRAFTREKGITPYRYLEAVRIGEAKKLLAAGASPTEVAVQTGFSDQSHFTNYFGRLTGLSPGVYREIFEKKKERGNTYEK